jgi:hypothetical protein
MIFFFKAKDLFRQKISLGCRNKPILFARACVCDEGNSIRLCKHSLKVDIYVNAS